MIIPMTTTGRPQQRYDHRLRDLVQGITTFGALLSHPRAVERGPPRSVAMVGSLVKRDVTDLSASELQQEVVELRDA
jgi:hypothetical protein